MTCVQISRLIPVRREGPTQTGVQNDPFGEGALTAAPEQSLGCLRARQIG